MELSTLINDVRRAVTFDASFYRQAANDERYSQQAVMVVIIVSALSGLGAFLGSLLGGNVIGALLVLILGVIMSIVGYYVWAYVIYYVGAQFFQGRATTPQLLRTLGYAYAPMALGLLSFIPCFGGLIALVGWLWSIACGFFAVREVHQLDDGKTLLTVIIGWVAVAIITAIFAMIGAIFGFGAMGIGSLFSG
ncbi:MAG: YIP1 family protein [Caldilinea sp.]|uniref:YIP1 family protein n=1 Tax=Caldilinea sp. TaxID=2293560 RepID=UPI002C7DD72B|nr:YIP1 family protein [Anaerolineales bacterium]HQY92828.1 YIP1 family protein [Caldilinea sp.]